MKILVLDDQYERHRAFDYRFADTFISIEVEVEVGHVYTSDQAIKALEVTLFDVVYLDHDLGDKDKGTGYDVAKWLEEHKDRCPSRIIVHSMNPVGAANILAVLPGAVHQPGCWLNEHFKGVDNVTIHTTKQM